MVDEYRKMAVEILSRGVLKTATGLFGTRPDALGKFDDYEGAANLVYEYEQDGKPLILRISFRTDRSANQIRAELDFINYLAANGVRVSRPIYSRFGNLVETIEAQGTAFHTVSFLKGKGMRVPDNGYRYRVGIPIEEYFRNWGSVLGRMHAKAKDYRPAGEIQSRPDWFELHQIQSILNKRIPVQMALVRQRVNSLLDEIRSLPRDRGSYGLIHGDFNDGNFTVDYTNGDITVFDFDDACYFWYVYELAAAWEGGIGRVMFRDLAERKDFMASYMDELLAGYSQENHLSDDWLARIPLFIRLIQVEEFLHYAQYLDAMDGALRGEMDYKIRCIEDEIPYMGFFDALYSPQRPFSLG